MVKARCLDFSFEVVDERFDRYKGASPSGWTFWIDAGGQIGAIPAELLLRNGFLDVKTISFHGLRALGLGPTSSSDAGAVEQVSLLG
jgi:hypothetical protein